MSQIKRNFKESQSLSLCVSTSDVKPSEINKENKIKNAQVQGLLNGNRSVICLVRKNIKNINNNKYFLFDVFKAQLIQVGQEEFKNSEGRFLKIGVNLVKYTTVLTKLDCLNILHKYKTPLWETHSNFSDFLGGCKFIIDSIQCLGSSSMKIRNIGMEPFKNFFSSVLSLTLQCVDLVERGGSINSILNLCLELYRLYSGTKVLKNDWETHMFLNAGISAASMFLPKDLFEVFRRMSMFSNAKLLDEMSGVFRFYSLVTDYLSKLIEYLPFTLPTFFTKGLNTLFDLRQYEVIYEIRLLYSVWRKNPKVVLDHSFISKVENLQQRIAMEVSLPDWARRSCSVANCLKDFKVLVKTVDAYKNSSRIEPCCFVFEGPPGCMKSVYMNRVISTLNMSSYAHIVKSTSDGKDFYDSYNNEEIFYMDDVGQQGVSQFRCLINMVAPVKYPLECASAELKDTKFFSSKNILFTTNRFSHISGITKADCIDNIQALWRRAYVFDFATVSRKGGVVSGAIQFKHFDVKTGWQSTFPLDLQEALLNQGYTLETWADASDVTLTTAWMNIIIETYNLVKENQYSDNSMSVEELALVDRSKLLFKTQCSFAETCEWATDKSKFIYDLLKESITNFYNESILNLQDLSVDSFVYPTIITMISATILYSVWFFLKKRQKSKFLTESFIPDEVLKKINNNNISLDSLHPSVVFLQKQLMEIDVISMEGGSCSAVGLISGRRLVTVSHISDADESFLIMYKNREANHRIIDNVKIKLIYRDNSSDYAIWELPNSYPSPFKDLSKLFVSGYQMSPLLVHPRGALRISSVFATGVEINTPYVHSKTREHFGYLKPTDFFYSLSYPSLCGSLIVSGQGTVLGIHVAGSSTTIGCSLRWEDDIINKIGVQLNHTWINIDANISNKVIPNFSGIKLEDDLKIFTPKTSNYIPSPLFGVLDITRVPVDLTIYGNHTIKDISKKAFDPVKSANNYELQFSKAILHDLIDPFQDISMNEVINGTRLLSGINKKSSNGYGCPQGKKTCIDYDLGELTPSFKEDYEYFISKVKKGVIKVEDVVWCETLKDELRPLNKTYPRSFRVSRLHLQVLTKQIFGNMVEHIVDNRKNNQIMIGVNPFKEWEEIFTSIKPYKKWAGDIGKYDGRMLPQVMQIIYEVFREKYTGDMVLFDFIFSTINNSIVAVNDDTFITTHSMPSGCFLTAIMNSLINRAYTAMWYFRNVPIKSRSVCEFKRTIIDYVYGDDKVNAITDNKYEESLNGVTMKEFFESLGMTFTDSRKGDIDTPFQSLKEITFLKRSFEYHAELRKIVGPLDMNTICSSLSWVDSKKNVEEVMRDKLNAFQREIYLHGSDIYKEKMSIVRNAARAEGIAWRELSQNDLINLYNQGLYEYNEDLYGIKIE